MSNYNHLKIKLKKLLRLNNGLINLNKETMLQCKSISSNLSTTKNHLFLKFKFKLPTQSNSKKSCQV